MIQQNIVEIEIKNLRLWTENPRDPIDPNSSDFEIIKRAVDENPTEWNLDKLVKEMGDYYDFSELPTVVYLGKSPVVFDGNRRIAVLKYLQDRELYSNISGKLYLKDGPKALRELHKIPCNVCDKDTALTNIERKHVNNGSWGIIQREYFLHQHRNQPKSQFLIIEEQTGLISSFTQVNQGFVKDEVFSEKNLKDVGFGFENGKFVSVYEDEELQRDILQKIASLLESKNITTRKNRGLLKQPLLEKFPEIKQNIVTFGKDIHRAPVNTKFDESTQASSRRTPITSPSDELFGRKLILKKGPVNDLYCGMVDIYERFKDKDNAMPIIAMSLRLILDIAARIYFEDKGKEIANKDDISSLFIKEAKAALKDAMKQKTKNSSSLTLDWVSDKLSLEGILHKYAHGNIDYSKQTIVQNSKVVADILEYYFKRDTK